MIKYLAVISIAVAAAISLIAQINLPVTVSQRGSVSQRIGVTDVGIDYGRPSANKRALWGTLVPFEQVWRAGANENTVFTVSTTVAIDGKELAAGRYGLHMIPGATEWTIIFNRDSHAWGSYFYKKENDALRIVVTPTTSLHTELLTYDVPAMTKSTATFHMRWGSIAVPFTVAVDLGATVVPDIKTQLTGVPGFDPQNYAVAATWLVQNNIELPLAKKWLDLALRSTPSFPTLMLAAKLAESEQQGSSASDYRKKALEVGTNVEINAYGYELLQAGKVEESITVFAMNVKRFPTDPNVWDSMGEAYGTNNNKDKAIECFNKALSMNPSPDVRKNSEMCLQKLR